MQAAQAVSDMIASDCHEHDSLPARGDALAHISSLTSGIVGGARCTSTLVRLS